MTELIQEPVDTTARPLRILILAPTGRDGETTVGILSRAGFTSESCSSAEELCRGIREGAGVAIVTAEALTPVAMREIARTLASQPPWSEIPILIFVAHPDMDRAARTFDPLGPRAHVTLLIVPFTSRLWSALHERPSAVAPANTRFETCWPSSRNFSKASARWPGGCQAWQTPRWPSPQHSHSTMCCR